MRTPHCYMPQFVNDKVVKRGSYCNWESVVAHAKDMHEQGHMSEQMYDEVVKHVEQITGVFVEPGPHYTELLHGLKGKYN